MEIMRRLVSGKGRIRTPHRGTPNPRALSSPSFGLCLQAGSALTGRRPPRGAAPQPGAPAAPARTGLRAQGARAHAAARAPRRWRRRRHSRAFLFGSPRQTSCVHVWAFTSRRQGRGLPKWQWPRESEALCQRRRCYISGGAAAWGSPAAL